MICMSKPLGTIAYLGGIPAVPEEFCWSWAQMVQYNAESLGELGASHVHYDRAKASYHVMARNSLVDNMYGEWLLQIDCDMQFEPDLAVRLLHRMQETGADIVTGVYCTGPSPHLPVLWGTVDGQFQRIGGVKDLDVFKVSASGGGALLVRKTVFDLIKSELNEQPFDIIPPYSEDLSFFKRCEQLGLVTVADWRINPGHLRNRSITLSDWQPHDSELVYEDIH